MDNTANHSARWIPWAILAFFASFMLLLSGFAWIAFHTYPGEVTEDTYNKGIAYNTALSNAAAQENLRWKGVLQTMQKDNSIDITFDLKDASGKLIDDAKVVARLTRPTQAGHDVQMTLHYDKGMYSGTANLEWAGMWDIRISATRGHDNYQQSKTIIMQ